MIYRSIKVHGNTQMLCVSEQGSTVDISLAMVRKDTGLDNEELLLSLSKEEAKELLQIFKETLE